MNAAPKNCHLGVEKEGRGTRGGDREGEEKGGRGGGEYGGGGRGKVSGECWMGFHGDEEGAMRGRF